MPSGYNKNILFVLVFLFAAISCFPQLPFPGQMNRHQFDSVHMMLNQRLTGPATRKPIIGQHYHPATRGLLNMASGGLHSPNFTVCFDTSGRFFLKTDSMTYYVTADISSSDGNILVSGEYVINKPPYLTGGYLMKCNDSGNVQWMRLYDSAGHSAYSYFNYYRLLQLNDGTILMAGGTNDEINQNDDLVLTHVDNNGNIIWSKTYTSRIWQRGFGSAGYFYVQQMQQDPASGDIFFTGPHWSNGKNVTRININDGTVRWSKYYDMFGADFDHPFGLDVTGNNVVVFCRYSGYYGGTNTSIFQLNKITGDTISTRYFKTIDPTGFNLGFLGTEALVKMNNGHYLISGPMFRYWYALNDSLSPLDHAGVAEFDQNFNFVKAYYISNNYESNYYNTRITTYNDGTGIFTMLKSISLSGYSADAMYVQFRDGQIMKQRIRRYNGEGIPIENPALRQADGSDLMIKLLGDSATNINKIEFLNLHVSDTSSSCLGMDDNSNVIKSYQMQPVSWEFDSVGLNDFSESYNKTISISGSALDYVPACRQISYCDTLSLVPSADTICLSTPFLMTFRKNPACGASLFLNYDTTLIQSYTKVNDSLYQFNFKSPGITKIYGSIFGCSLLTDSVKIVVIQSPGNVNLGADTIICPGNTIRLNAKPGYLSYLWQDGSTDSIYVVNQPGLYYVSATDSCGNIFKDSIAVAPHPPIPFDIGPDISICERDTAVITAPSSFINYHWTPNYRIDNLTSQSVKVSPLVDTMYHVRAEKTPGCFVEDSILIHINHAPPVNIGPDKSFCSGDSLLIDAGPGFVAYAWNTGKTTQQITVYNAGNYSVIATTADGCTAKDTLAVLNVFANPVVNLGGDSIICEGKSRVLDAGNFNTYLWNTGNTGKNITVSQTGWYSVTVTDINNCKGNDSILINKIVPPPAGFLPGDTAICTYGKLLLNAAGNYSNYLWSTNASTSTITVATAGMYWLEVTDKYNCKGRDSIVVTSKDCLKGFYIPNAFTPNEDGKNDVFRPLIFGNLIKYEFIIYDRYGKVVFRTTELRKGWDGNTSSSTRQSTNTFVWICKYQLENEPEKIEKGVVLMVK